MGCLGLSLRAIARLRQHLVVMFTQMSRPRAEHAGAESAPPFLPTHGPRTEGADDVKQLILAVVGLAGLVAACGGSGDGPCGTVEVVDEVARQFNLSFRTPEAAEEFEQLGLWERDGSNRECENERIAGSERWRVRYAVDFPVLNHIYHMTSERDQFGEWEMSELSRDIELAR